MDANGIEVIGAGKFNTCPSKAPIGDLRIHPAARGKDGMAADDAVGNLQTSGFAVVTKVGAKRFIHQGAEVGRRVVSVAELLYADYVRLEPFKMLMAKGWMLGCCH